MKALTFLCILALAACQPGPKRYTVNVPRGDVTGKGNGGNPGQMTEVQVSAKLSGVRDPLKKIFEALQFLRETERLSPSTTALSGRTALINLIDLMTGDGPRTASRSVFHDIDIQNNLRPQSGACVDAQGNARTATSVAGEFGGQICFSTSRLAMQAPRGAEVATDIMILAMAAHEFGHHFLNGNPAQDEVLVTELQDFITTQLHAADVISGDVVSISPLGFVDTFHLDAKGRLERARRANGIN